MHRCAHIIEVLEEKRDEHKRLHAAVWPEVLDRIAQSNMRNCSTYLRRLPVAKHYLFSHFEYIGNDFEADMAADPTTQEWWAVGKPCQKPPPETGTEAWWADMEQVFHQD